MESLKSRPVRHVALALGGLLLVALVASPSRAIPQFAVESARGCYTCHLNPDGWENPKLADRKCSLNCNACHVNPTGGGLKHEAGIFYGHTQLAAIGPRPTDQFTPATSPAPPASPARFAGIETHPRLQGGGDLRLMAYRDESESEASVFPMQFDLHLALTPYNPPSPNRGRLTFYTTVGAEGSREQEFENFTDRLFVREAFILAHDFPYQIYAKAGRFTPAFGWKLDDHTTFIRQGQGFDHERQVSGLEVGLNPNYLFAHASLYSTSRFSAAGERLGPLTHQADPSGWGTALHAGYRELLWQAGGSLMYEDRKDTRDLWLGTNWSLNLFRTEHHMKGAEWGPWTYLGEFDLRRTEPASGETRNGLTAYHEVDYLATRWLRFIGRYDWQDPDLDFKDDHRDRVTLGYAVHPFTGVEIIAAYRVNRNGGEDLDDNEAFLQLHLWH